MASSGSSPRFQWREITVALVVPVAGILFVGGKQYGDNEANTKAVAEQRAQIAENRTQIGLEAVDAKDLRVNAVEMREDMKAVKAAIDRVDKHVIAECAARTHDPERCSK